MIAQHRHLQILNDNENENENFLKAFDMAIVCHCLGVTLFFQFLQDYILKRYVMKKMQK